ncbi:replicative DNA helicase [Bremerella sp. T1]|uniref:replicative DNA helicase n=1 Tax=Bremerella sp. TYQ1 TaxID=3119568 RepID=UPI001CCC7E53|nr:DnaB-like helicase C-terminal domain-containing protein [Bremerella volcania]UBM37367.1 AAA family ATPase [Bremerella volcania]
MTRRSTNIEEYPHSDYDEEIVLGRLIMSPEFLDEVQLKPTDFYHVSHQKIFRAAKELVSEGQEFNYITLKDWLEKSGELELVGGLRYISDLARTARVGSDTYIASCAEIVRRKSIERSIIDFGFRVQTITSDASLGSDEKRALLSKLFTDLEDGVDTSGERWLADHVSELADLIEAGEFKPRDGIPTPFPTLNKITGGLPPGLICIAGRPGDGKSVSALEFVLNASGKGSAVPGLVTMEMDGSEVARRALARQSEVDQDEWGRLDEPSKRKVMSAADKLKSGKVIIEDRGNLKVSDIVSKIRRWKRRYNCGLVAIDYLQLLNPDSAGETRAREIAVMTRQLKLVSLELKIPVIILSQLNRSGEGRPSLRNLRESGAIEQDCDIVLGLWREDTEEGSGTKSSRMQRLKGKQIEPATKEDGEPDKVTLSVLKNRNGPVGRDIKLLFWGQYFKFAEEAPAYMEEDFVPLNQRDMSWIDEFNNQGGYGDHD